MASFNANPRIISKQVSQRKIQTLLPGSVQTTPVNKMFDGAINAWFQPESSEQISGYIGRKEGNYYQASQDFYVDEARLDNKHYQLEPIAASIDAAGVATNVASYVDLVNALGLNGALTANQDRLFNQEYYSWAPPINVDMLVNFSNYYWIIGGPETFSITVPTNVILNVIGQTQATLGTLVLRSGMRIVLTNDSNADMNNVSFLVEGVGTSIQLINDKAYDGLGLYDVDPYDTTPYDDAGDINPDYITIRRGSVAMDPWSRSNRWFHKSLIGSIDTGDITLFQARRPIIEFESNIQLYDFARFGRKDVNLIITNKGLLDIAGQPSYTIDGVDLADGQRVLFINDPDPAKNNRIYKVYGILAMNKIAFLLETDGLDVMGTPVAGEGIRVLENVSLKNTQWFFDGTAWVQGQNKTLKNQEPLFSLYDHTGTSLNDAGIYPESNFAGSTLFAYLQTATAPVDPILNKRVAFDSFGHITFDNTIYTQDIHFTSNFTQIAVPGFHYYKMLDPRANVVFDRLDLDWHRVAYPSKQYVLNEFVIKSDLTSENIIEFNRIYTLSIIPDADIIGQPPFVQVKKNGVVLERGIDYDIINGNQLELSLTLALVDNDVIEVRSWSKRNTLLDTNGYYEIPPNLECNPNNLPIDQVAFNELSQHFTSIVANQTGLIGNPAGSNNFTDTTRDLGRGELILNHSAPLLKAMLTIGNNSDLDIFTALRWNAREYDRFVKKFTNKLKDLYTRGFGPGDSAQSWIDQALLELNVGKTSDFAFAHSAMIADGTFIPNSLAVLGITPLYQPTIFLDTTRLNPTQVLQCHDGRLVNVTNTPIDAVLLAFEQSIYDACDAKYKAAERIFALDSQRIIPGYFRDTEYTRPEFLSLLKQSFDRWVVDNRVDWTTNNIYDSGNQFTWNYSKSHAPNGTLLPGHWRGIYRWIYDTDRPHTHPWEMLGFSQKPAWWDITYGPAPYTGANAVMWNDIELGKIAAGDKVGIYPHLARPGLHNMIPVDATGTLLSPIQAGVVHDLPNEFDAASTWSFGDCGPGEYAWRISTAYPWGLFEALLLAKPAQAIELSWQANLLENQNGQFFWSDVDQRKASSDFIVHNQTIDGVLQSAHGLGDLISERLTYLGKDINTYWATPLNDLDVRLAYRTGSFITTDKLRLLADNFGLLPSEDIQVQLHQSPSIGTKAYSGIIIEWTGSDYRISGYDTIDQEFLTIPGRATGSKTTITVGNAIVTRLNDGGNQIVAVNYGTIFHSREQLYNFMVSYGRWLTTQGWVFGQLDTNAGDTLDFDYAGRQFLEWSNNDLTTGESIILSPLANSATVTIDHGLFDDIQKLVDGVYPIIDRAGLGINTENFIIDRGDNQLSISMNDTTGLGIYGLKLNIIDFEHIIIVDNVTRFNDLIYSPQFGIRQPRLRLFEQRTTPWNGTLYAPGYVISGGTLIPNFEKTVDDIRLLYDTDNNTITKQKTDIARHLIGYQPRTYLDNLLLDESIQYDFYRGMIRQKGTNQAITKLLRSNFVTETASFDLLEEWALKIGTYGSTALQSSIQLRVLQSEFKTNPQCIDFITGSVDSLGDNVISITPNDARWLLKNPENTSINQFPMRSFGVMPQRSLPNAGYARLDEVTYTIAQDSNTAMTDFYTTTVITNGGTISDGQTIWTFINDSGNWDVLRVCSIARIESINQGLSIGDPAHIILESAHGLASGDRVFVLGDTGTSPNFQGYQVVDTIVDTTTFTVDLAPTATQSFVVGTGPMVAVLKSVRFANQAERNSFIPPMGHNVGDLAWVDSATHARWEVFYWSGSTWVSKHQQPDLPATEQIDNVWVYNNITHTNTVQLDLLDPSAGFILSPARAALSYMIEYDPAKYNQGDATLFQIDPDQAWGPIEAGQLWWDLSTVRFIDCNQDDIEYARRHWAQVAPGCTVDILEWTRSPVAPTDWDAFVTQFVSLDGNKYSGTTRYGSDTPYVTRQEYNEMTGSFDTMYYFWVVNPEYVPVNQTAYRTQSAADIAQLISQPNNSGIAWIAPIASNAMLVEGIDQVIDDDSSILQINFYTKPNEGATHEEWRLGRNRDSVTPPDPMFWNKMTDSLKGFDATGLAVPDPSLGIIQKLGNLVRPRQTWFDDRQQARRAWVDKANKLLNVQPVIDNITTWSDHLYTEQAQPAASTYNYIVFDRTARDALIGTIIAGQKVLVEHDQLLNSHWSLWQYNGGQSWTLISQQLWRTQDYWSIIDWYETGYSISSTIINSTYATLAARNADIHNIGDIILVQNDGSGRWAWYVYSEENSLPVYSLVAHQQATIALSAALYNYALPNAVDQERSIVVGELQTALRLDLLSILQQNQLFYAMINYVHVEQGIVDWAFKTSYVYGLGASTPLVQNYIFIQNQSSSFVDYANEVKPYHTKLRSLVEQKEPPVEKVNLNIGQTLLNEISFKLDRVTIETSIPEGANPRDYDINTLNAADRVQLFYKPTQGMPAKVLKNLINRGNFAGTVLDGGNFYAFATLVGVGYDTTPYDLAYGYDFDEQTLEDFYDVFVNGGTFTNPASTGPAGIVVSGNSFIQPYLEANHPEELVPARVGDAIMIEVYSESAVGAIAVGYSAEAYDQYSYDYDAADVPVPFGGRPLVRSKQFMGNSQVGPFTIGQTPQSAQALFIYEDGILLKQTIDYTIDWTGTNPTVTFTVPTDPTKSYAIISFSIGGSALIKKKTFKNTSATQFDMGVTVGAPNTILAIVDGTLATVTTSGTLVTVTSPIPSNSTVIIAAFANELFSVLHTQEFIAVGGPETFTISNPAKSTVPAWATTVVHLNGTRLNPPYMKYYDIEDATTAFKIGHTPSNAANVYVWIDDQLLVQGIDYTVNIADEEVDLATMAPQGSRLLVMLVENNDYDLTGIAFDQLTVIDPITALPKVLTAGDRVQVTTFNEDISYAMRTESFDGNAAGSYPLGFKPFDTNSAWVTVNGDRALYGQSWVLKDQEQGYDSDYVGYDTNGYDWSSNLSVDFKDGTQTSADRITVTYFVARPFAISTGFRLYKNIFGNWVSQRISDQASTVLAQPLLSTDTQVIVNDATVLGQPNIANNIPGVIIIGAERITFWTVDISTPGQHILGQCLRSTQGTAIMPDQLVGAVVRDASKNQDIPGGYYWSFNVDGLQYADSTLANFLKAEPGTLTFP